MNQKRARDLGFYVLLIVIMIAVIFTMTQSSDAKKVKTYSDLVDLFNDKKVQSFTTEGNTIILRGLQGRHQGAVRIRRAGAVRL